MAQKTMRAVKVLGPNEAEIQEVPIPETRSYEILVKVRCVALNPVDWKLGLALTPVAGSTLGSDFSGTVAGVGTSVKKPWKVGDRVLGWVVGNNIARKDNGGWAEYCALDAELCVRVPDSMSDEEAASPAAGIATAGFGMFQKHELPLPVGDATSGQMLLVYGGTSATATIAIQLGKLAGLNILTTCSARNFDAVKRLGATEAFDYKDPECGKKIREYTKDGLTMIFDTIPEGSSVQICEAAMSSKGGVVSTTLPWPEDRERKNIEARMLFTFGMLGTETGYGEQVIPANLMTTKKMLHEGKLQVHPPKICNPGLEGVFDAIQQAKDGKGSGVKLIVKL